MSMKIVVPALAALVAAPAFAALSPQTALPARHHRGNVTYMSGGIGQDEARAMQLERSGKRDDFLADMPVTIRDGKGDVVFRGRSAGPYFLAKLPAGRYTVSSREDGRAVTRDVDVGGKGTRRVVFEWRHEAGRERA